MKSILVIFLFILSVTTVSCNKKLQTPAANPGNFIPVSVPLPEKRINDLAYGSHPQQVMDIFLPAGRNTITTKLLLMVHGGQWVAGDKADMEGYITLLKSKLPDFAFANINYRLINGSTVLMPTPEEDIQRALSFIWSKSDSLKISRKTVLLGESAGGQLALLNAFKLASPNIKAAVGIKSPTHFTEWYNTAANPQIKPMLEFITGGTPLTAPGLYAAISPVNFVSPGDPPTLLIHGDGDGFVLTQQAILLANKMDQCGVINQLNLLPGEAHALSLNAQLQVYDIIAAFLSNSNLYR